MSSVCTIYLLFVYCAVCAAMYYTVHTYNIQYTHNVYAVCKCSIHVHDTVFNMCGIRGSVRSNNNYKGPKQCVQLFSFYFHIVVTILTTIIIMQFG